MNAVIEQDAPSTAEAEHELLSFRMGDQAYCVDIMCVREIRSATPATPLPKSPPAILGVINLRGTVLPIMDLSQRLSVQADEEQERSVIIVVAHDRKTVGLLVDAVSDILTISSADLQDPPDLPENGDKQYISGLTIHAGNMIRVLDLDAVLSSDGGGDG